MHSVTTQNEPETLPYSLPLELTVTDPEVIAELNAKQEGRERDEYALGALRLGVLAFKQARGQIDAGTLRHEGERLLGDVQLALSEHRTGIDRTLVGTLKDYFDPKDGRFNERVERLLKKDGELETLLSRKVTAADSEMCRALSTLVGKDILTKEMNVTDCPAIFGRDAHRNVLAAGHQHSHFLPLDLDEDGRLDHLLVYAPMGLDALAQRAITRLRRTWAKGSDRDLFVTCAGFGDLDLFRRELRVTGGGGVSVLPQRPAHVWTSVTPYVPSRHLKSENGRYTVEDDARRELLARGITLSVDIDDFGHRSELGRAELIRRNLLRFVRMRREGSPQPRKPLAFGLRLTFTNPVPGPLAIGYASHFGLGLFAAEFV